MLTRVNLGLCRFDLAKVDLLFLQREARYRDVVPDLPPRPAAIRVPSP
jgi:hypothetical protein